MGFSSFTCAKTNIPVAGTAAAAERAHAEVVVLVEGEEPFRGLHDGYGRVTGSSPSRGVGVVDLNGRGTRAMLRDGRAKVVLAAFHGPGDAIGDLGRNARDPGQGLHRSAFLRDCHEAGGFRSYEGYLLAFEGVLSPAQAAGLDKDRALAIGETRTALREEVAKLRTAAIGATFPDAARAYPHYLDIAPAGTGTDAWVAAPNRSALDSMQRKATDAFAEACAGVAVPVEGGTAARKAVRAAANALVDAIRPETKAVVPVTRGGEPAGEVRTMTCPMCGDWYEARLDGEPALAFHAPHSLAMALDLDDDLVRAALWKREDAPGSLDLEPAPAFTP